MRLWKYVLRRILYLIPLFFGISIIVFALTRLAGNPITIMTAGNPRITPYEKQLLTSYYGLSGSVVTQYVRWLTEFLQGNFGYSIYYHIPVNLILGYYAWNTIELQIVSLLLSLALAIPIGIMSARKQYSKMDMSVTTFSMLGISMPVFFTGLLALLVFAYILPWFPGGGYVSGGSSPLLFGNYFIDHLWHLTLPMLILTFADMATVVMLVRSSMLEVLRQDYVLAASASGLSEGTVVYRHALRNALIPVVTYIGLYLGGMLAGAPVTETVFNWPGLGRLFVSATSDLDFPIIQAVTMVITLMTLAANLATDILYAYIDPRIRLE